MKTISKILIITFALVLMILSGNSRMVYAVDKKSDTFEYNKMTMQITKTASANNYGTVSIISCSDKKSTKKLNIPSEIEYNNKIYKITCIDSAAFRKSKFREIYFPNNSINIKWHAFKDCTNLTSITIPSNVTLSEGHNFSGCTSLRTVTIEEGLTKIPLSTFYGCTSLSKVIIPSSVKSIDSFAFHNCSSLKEIILPEDLNEIGQDAFSGCSNLISIQIPSSVTKIGFYAFKGCNNLTAIIPKYSLLEKSFVDNKIKYQYSDETVLSVEFIEAFDTTNGIVFYKITNTTSKTYYDFNIEYILLDSVGDQIGGGIGTSVPIFKSGENYIYSTNAENQAYSDMLIICNNNNYVNYEDMSNYVSSSYEVVEAVNEQTNKINKEYCIKVNSNSSFKIDIIRVQIVFYKDNKIIGITGSYFNNIYKGTASQQIKLPVEEQYDDYIINIFAYNYKHK